MDGKTRKKGSSFRGLFQRRGRDSSTAPSQGTKNGDISQKAESPASASRASVENKPQAQDTAPNAGPVNDVDGERTLERYLRASDLLQEAIRGNERAKGLYDFSELAGEPGNSNVTKFKEAIDDALSVRRRRVRDDTFWKKCEHALECLFTAMSPFAKNFLAIAKEGQSKINVKIAERELARKQDIANQLEYINRQLEQLDIVASLPEDFEQRSFLTNRALDVRSASMIYLGALISQDSVSLSGDANYTDAQSYLEFYISEYTRAVANMQLRISIQVYEIVKSNHRTIHMSNSVALSDLNLGTLPVEEKFRVPHERNPMFVGRAAFLRELKETLALTESMRYNHRVALFGMGGIGKTQCALEYVYQNRGDYERVYWITAVDQASLLSGYDGIARAANIQGLQYLDIRSIAESVIRWLGQQPNWLLVIDNLDDIGVVDGLLPNSGLRQHTLITTRNPNTFGIPAVPFEVPVLDKESSIELLSILSGIPAEKGSQKEQEAGRIVMELGYLPLAIAQAASYVRQVLGDWVEYLRTYQENRRVLMQWSRGNRSYPYSVATTWSLAFNIVQTENPSAVRFLRLCSFLNPDSILIEFLEAGADGLDGQLKEAMISNIRLVEGLLSLERFSLLKWDRVAKSISIHRMIQTVVHDQMDETEFEIACTNFINLCLRAFPVQHTIETRHTCRKYQAQVVEPILRADIQTLQAATLSERVAEFLCADRKYEESEKLYLKAVHIRQRLLGDDDDLTLSTMNELAWTYQEHGRVKDAMFFNEKVVDKRKSKLGIGDPDTLAAMEDLALNYELAGRSSDSVHLNEEILKERLAMMEEHPDTAAVMHNLGRGYQKTGKLKEAGKMLEDALRIRKMLLGDGDSDTIQTRQELASVYRREERIDEAVELERENSETRGGHRKRRGY